MVEDGHLWVIGFDATDRAGQVRAEITKLAERRSLILVDTAVVVRHPDGSTTLNGEPFVPVPRFRGQTVLSFLAGLAMGAPPLTGSAAGAWVTAAGGTAAEVGIDDHIVNEVQALMKPGTSALFVLDQDGDMPAILEGIRGLGGTVIRTNVDIERAKLIQSTLIAAGGQMKDRP
jgi:uncharacterized membrane protein